MKEKPEPCYRPCRQCGDSVTLRATLRADGRYRYSEAKLCDPCRRSIYAATPKGRGGSHYKFDPNAPSRPCSRCGKEHSRRYLGKRKFKSYCAGCETQVIYQGRKRIALRSAGIELEQMERMKTRLAEATGLLCDALVLLEHYAPDADATYQVERFVASGR